MPILPPVPSAIRTSSGKSTRCSRTDNLTNWFYLAREYLFAAILIGGAIALCETCFTSAWSLLWAIPLVLFVNLCIGATQHRLATFTHEAAHYMLFRNRLLNEFVSEWFCMFPILGTTHSYRVQHIGHHQYPNDPELDPDWAQLRLSGHRFRFPMTTGQFLWHCFFKQILWWPNLLRYVLVRATFRVDMGNGPYRMKRKTALPIRLLGLGFHLAMVGVLIGCVWTDNAALMSWLPTVLLAGGLVGVAARPRPMVRRIFRQVRHLHALADRLAIPLQRPPAQRHRLAHAPDRQPLVALLFPLLASCRSAPRSAST